MSRNLKGEVIVLKSVRLQEFHKIVFLISPTLGLLQAIAHGAYKGKGKLAATTELFVCSSANLYHDPVKRSYKITEMEPIAYFDAIRSDLERFYAASVMAETILKSYGGGEGYDRVYVLLKEALGLLDSGAVTERIELQFLWRLIALLGFLPEIESCGSCGRAFHEGALYRLRTGDLICRACAGELSSGGEERYLPLPAGALRYLAHTGRLSLSEAAVIGLDRRCERAALAFLHGLVEEIVETPLLSLRR